jgi:hypothetical protein
MWVHQNELHRELVFVVPGLLFVMKSGIIKGVPIWMYIRRNYLI